MQSIWMILKCRLRVSEAYSNIGIINLTKKNRSNFVPICFRFHSFQKGYRLCHIKASLHHEEFLLVVLFESNNWYFWCGIASNIYVVFYEQGRILLHAASKHGHSFQNKYCSSRNFSARFNLTILAQLFDALN